MTSSNAAIMTGPTVNLDGVLQGASIVGAGSAEPVQAQPQAEAASRVLEQRAEQLELAKQAMDRAVAEFARRQEEFFTAAESQMVDLAVEIARKILACEIEAGNYQIDTIVSEALGQISASAEVVVYLNPDDLSTCELAAKAADDEDNPRSIHFVGDTTVGRGECRVETDHGVVASSIAGQLAEIGTVLKDEESGVTQ